MNADPTPIAADDMGNGDLLAESLGQHHDTLATTNQFIGGNRRWIGVHRRFQSLSPA
jgi:hypothetical protein